METSIQIIPLTNLAFAFIPVIVALMVMVRWSLQAGNALYSIIRMVVQLILVGYVLVFLFKSNDVWITTGVVAIMIIASSWIALRTLQSMRRQLFLYTIVSSLIGGGSVLLIVLWLVLELMPLYKPQYTIPLAGMIFANAMNTISLALERLHAELKNNVAFEQARNIALQTSLIPIINMMFAVGLVSLPGMMTGQVLSGVSPLIAVRYQIMVMCMIFASSALATACLLALSRSSFEVRGRS